MRLEEITSGANLEGVEPKAVVGVVAAIPIPPALVNVAPQKRGWHLTSYPPAAGDRQPDARHIEMKALLARAEVA